MTYMHINEQCVKDTRRRGEGAAHDQEKPVTDPGFPRQGHQPVSRGAKTYYFARILSKTA